MLSLMTILCLLPFLLILLPSVVFGQEFEIPQKFFGAFKLDHSDNLDAYLAAKGFDQATRSNFQMPKLTRVIFPLGSGTYRMMIGTGLEGSHWVKGSKKNADWTFQLGKEFRAKYWDGNDHLIRFTYDSNRDRLSERHIPVQPVQADPEVFEYSIDGDGNLELHTSFKGVELVHHYQRTD